MNAPERQAGRAEPNPHVARDADVPAPRSRLMTREEYAQYQSDAELGRALREWQERAEAAESSHAIAAAADWRRVASAPSQAELQRRRSVPGPLAREIDPPEVVARWVETGSSAPPRQERDQQQHVDDEPERALGL